MGAAAELVSISWAPVKIYDKYPENVGKLSAHFRSLSELHASQGAKFKTVPACKFPRHFRLKWLSFAVFFKVEHGVVFFMLQS